MTLEKTLEAMNEELVTTVTLQEQDAVTERYNTLIEEAEKQLELQFDKEIKADNKLLDAEISVVMKNLKKLDKDVEKQIEVEKRANDKLIKEAEARRKEVVIEEPLPVMVEVVVGKETTKNTKTEDVDFDFIRETITQNNVSVAAKKIKKAHVIEFAKSLGMDVKSSEREIAIVLKVKRHLKSSKNNITE